MTAVATLNDLRRQLNHFGISLIALLIGSSAYAETRGNTTSTLRLTAVPELTELSGLAASPSIPDLYWAHNDSGDSARAFAFDRAGRRRGEASIGNAVAIDWEDMDSFRDARGSWLLLADIGDNLAIRATVDIYLVAEPRLDTDHNIIRLDANRRFQLVYPNGARDAEAIAVDAGERFVYLLTKRRRHPELYRFSLDALDRSPIPLNYLGDIKSLPSPAQHRPQRNGAITEFSPTAMSFNASASAAIIVTPGETYLFTRRDQEPWLDALNRTPEIVASAPLPQQEAGTFSADGSSILVGSEGSPAIVNTVVIGSP